MINHQQVFAARDENEPADWDTSIDLLLMVVGLSVSILVEIMANLPGHRLVSCEGWSILHF